jgi:hypothetical protein
MTSKLRSPSTTGAAVEHVDVRGPRFAAWVTTAVLVVTLLVSSVDLDAAAVILGLQAVIFAKLVAPRIAPVTEKEPVPPLKFAQLVGFLFAVVGTVGFATGLAALGLAATGFALVAAFLNAAFAICLGCQLYPLIALLRRSRVSA